MNLSVDVGNTKTKIALFHRNQVQSFQTYFNEELDNIYTAINSLRFTHSIILFTAEDNQYLIDLLNNKSKCFILSTSLKLPISIAYKTKETLGKDRVAAACGAYNNNPDKPNLVITLGTCITYNILSDKNSFLGGSISPGIYMRYQAMNYFTDKLPLVENKNFNQLIGTSTEESLQSGVRKGIVAEVNGIIKEYELLYPNLRVFICGGDTSFFVNKLKSKIFADQYLVVRGMNTILLHNI